MLQNSKSGSRRTVRKLPQYGAGAEVREDGAGTREAAMEVVRSIWTPE